MGYHVPSDDEIGFVLGNEVQDEVTQARGITVQMVDHLNGCLQFAVQPPAVDGKVPDALSFDYQRLTKVGEGIKSKSEKWPEVDFILGNNVKDKVTGFIGITTNRVRDVSGECFYYVTPKVEKNEFPKGHYFSVERLVKVDDGIVPIKKSLTGGPETKMEAFNR
jgi:hypothetical protein